MRVRDFLEHRCLCARLVGRCSAGACGPPARERELPRRFRRLRRVRTQLRQHVDEDADHRWIERRRRLALDRCHRLRVTDRGVIRTIARQRVEVVDDGQDARAERDLVALQTARVAFSVPPLVVREDERGHGIGKRYRRDDLRTDLRVDLHFAELLLGEGARLRQDVFGDRKLADIVQQRGRAHALHLRRRHADRLRHGGRVALHPPDVGSRRLVLRIDGERQRFDGREMELRQFLEMLAARFEAGRRDDVHAIGEIERGRGDDPQPIAGGIADEDQERGDDGRAHDPRGAIEPYAARERVERDVRPFRAARGNRTNTGTRNGRHTHTVAISRRGGLAGRTRSRPADGAQ